MNPLTLVRHACHPFGRRRLLHLFTRLPDHRQLAWLFLLILAGNGLLLGLASGLLLLVRGQAGS